MDISYLGLGLSILLLLYPIIIFSHLKLKLTRQLFISVGRMILQLSLVGIWLEFLFNQQRWWLTLLWMLVMIGTAILTVKGRLRFQRKIILPVISTALVVSGIIIMPWILVMVIRPQPLYSPMFVIQIGRASCRERV